MLSGVGFWNTIKMSLDRLDLSVGNLSDSWQARAVYYVFSSQVSFYEIPARRTDRVVGMICQAFHVGLHGK